jgi:hypothetical protein
VSSNLTLSAKILGAAFAPPEPTLECSARQETTQSDPVACAVVIG